jgi:hypothetical protein
VAADDNRGSTAGKLKNLEEVQGDQKSKVRKGKGESQTDTCNCSIF